MRRPASEAWGEAVMVALPLLAALCELLIRYRYHWAAGDTGLVARLLLVLVLSGAGLWIAQGLRRRASRWSGRCAATLEFVIRLAGPLLCILTIFAPSASALTWWSALSMPGRLAALAILAVLCIGSLGGARYRRWRSALAIAAVFFVTSQVALAWIGGTARQWPRDPASAAGTVDPSPATVYVLLDESNSELRYTYGQALADAGLTVSHRAIDSVADGTAKAVPQMFTGLDFHNAKPCSFTAICSDRNILDFARIQASSADVDVVGFFHPYCDMKGLRYCRRLGVDMPLFSARQWLCSAGRLIHAADEGLCRQGDNDGWEQQKAATLQAFWAAPFWHEGGFLFTHLPLPHPPSSNPSDSLAEAYRRNVEEAVLVLKEVGRRVHERGGTVVVFSDHPLRAGTWCLDRRFAGPACEQSAAQLHDAQVPLVVGTSGRQPIDLSPYRNNGQVFDLLNAIDKGHRH